jgi:hypothetical protein
MVDPDRTEGLDDLVQESIRFKYIPAPLTQAQLDELIQIPRWCVLRLRAGGWGTFY